MNETLRKGLYLGIGTGLLLKESVEKAIGDLAEKSKTRTGETSEITEEVLKEVREQLEALQDKGSEQYEKMLGEAGLVTREEFDALQKRVLELELKVSGK